MSGFTKMEKVDIGVGFVGITNSIFLTTSRLWDTAPCNTMEWELQDDGTYTVTVGKLEFYEEDTHGG